VCPRTTIYASSYYYYMCVLMLYACPLTRKDVS
jgi:hypothetical protein